MIGALGVLIIGAYMKILHVHGSNLCVSLGLLLIVKKTTLRTNHENTEVMCHFGLKILFDGYLMTRGINITKTLTINSFLFDSHLIKEKL